MIVAVIGAATAIAIALGSALGWVAYNHHEAYRRMYDPLFNATMAIVIAIVAFNIGVLYAGSVVAQAKITPFEKYLEISKNINDATIPFWTVFIVGAMQIYLMFLRFMPDLGIRPK